MRAYSSRVTSRKLWLTSAVGAFAALALAGTAWSGSELRNDETFNLVGALPVPGSALVSFDISWVDPVLKRYYLGDRSNFSVDVIDTTTSTTTAAPTGPVTQFKPMCGSAPCFVGFTGNNNTSGPDGVMTFDNIDNNEHELWVGDGKSRVWVLSPTTGKVLALAGGAPNPIPTDASNLNRADELCYDPLHKLVMIANNADVPPFASLISTKTYKVVGKIVFDGSNGAPKSTNGIEQCGWSPRTKQFTVTVPGVNTPDDGTGVVAQIDPTVVNAPPFSGLGKVVATWPIDLKDCSTPQGQAVGPAPQILIGCNGPSPDGVYKTVIINENNGHIIQTLKNEGGNDEVWYNPGDGHYALARGQAPTQQYLGIIDSQFRAQDSSYTTGTPNGTTRRAHSVAADSNTNLIYMPIPASGGGTATTPGFQSGLCGITLAQQAAGCIAIFGPSLPNDRPQKVVERKKHKDDDDHHDWDDHHDGDNHRDGDERRDRDDHRDRDNR
jgi:hypothetical protein